MKYDSDAVHRGMALLALILAVGIGLIASSLAGGWAMFFGATIVAWFACFFGFAWLTSLVR